MIKFTTHDGQPEITAELKGCAVYLDNFALIGLARNVRLGHRFIEALRRGGTVLFSGTNALEIAGPQGTSSNLVRTFLDDIGPNWIPLELNPWKVVKREDDGLADQSPIAEWFVKAYLKNRLHELSGGSNKIIDISAESFFRLSSVLDWVVKDSVHIRARGDQFYDAFNAELDRLRSEYDKNVNSMDSLLPPIAFNQRHPATFVNRQLLRTLVIEAKGFKFKRNDALDFCHAVLAASYGTFVTLDKQWKRRVEQLSKPNHLAKVFYGPELAQLVDALEATIKIAS
jgi:hypothetical protein